MTQYDNTNSGALFKNEQKLTEKHPDYKGSVNVNGVDYWQSAWIRTSKDGKTYMSQSLQLKEQAGQSSGGAQQKAPMPIHDDFDDSIPF